MFQIAIFQDFFINNKIGPTYFLTTNTSKKSNLKLYVQKKIYLLQYQKCKNITF